VGDPDSLLSPATSDRDLEPPVLDRSVSSQGQKHAPPAPQKDFKSLRIVEKLRADKQIAEADAQNAELRLEVPAFQLPFPVVLIHNFVVLLYIRTRSFASKWRNRERKLELRRRYRYSTAFPDCLLLIHFVVLLQIKRLQVEVETLSNVL
jgi:hypothetical protein